MSSLSDVRSCSGPFDLGKYTKVGGKLRVYGICEGMGKRAWPTYDGGDDGDEDERHRLIAKTTARGRRYPL